MDDEVMQRVFQEGGRDYYQQPPSTSSSSSSSILQSLPLHVVCFLQFICSFVFFFLFVVLWILIAKYEYIIGLHGEI